MALSPKGRPRDGAPNRMMLRRTLFLLSVCGVAAFVVLAARLYQLQIVQHDELEARAIAQQVRETTVSAPRGTIYDRKGEVLAMSAGVDTIYLSPAEIEQYGEDAEAIAAGLADILGLDYETVYAKTQNTGSWYEVVARKVEEDVATQVREFKEDGGYNGVKIEADTKRYYPNGSLAAHVIGFVGTDNTGLGGIEAKYDKALSGTNGYVMRSTTAAGTDMLYTSWEDFFDAVPGSDVELTIDATIQYYVEKHLAQAVEDYDIQNGAAAICMEVDTGAILAMASLGNFDLNDYQTISDEAMAEIDATASSDEERAEMIAAAQQLMWRNKALSDTYEPGSTFKIITSSACLEEGVVSLDDTFMCPGYRIVEDRKIRCHKVGGHGSETFVQGIQNSCNPVFIDIGLRLGAEKFYDYFEQFGLLSLTNVDLPGEAGTIMHKKEDIGTVELATMTFGQSFQITPIQLATTVSSLVNGGVRVTPHLGVAVLDESGETIKEFEYEEKSGIVSEETSETMRMLLKSVVEEGSGKNGYIEGYSIGGKTATSQTLPRSANKYISSFLGFAPAEDPRILGMVVIHNPQGIYYGGTIAAPVLRDIYDNVLPYLA